MFALLKAIIAALRDLIQAVIALTQAVERLSDVMQPAPVATLNLSFGPPRNKGE